MRDSTRDDGQAALAMVIMVAVLFVALVMAAGTFGGRALDRTRAQTAADAAALGSLTGGRLQAHRLAHDHGATLVSWERGPGPHDVSVVVRLGTATATARATDAP